jgi:prevent-host-death family protein
MIKLISALEARTNLGSLLNKVSKNNERYLINRRGLSTAVILSIEDYLKNIAKSSNLLVEIQNEAVVKGSNKITDKEIEKEIQAYRKRK